VTSPPLTSQGPVDPQAGPVQVGQDNGSLPSLVKVGEAIRVGSFVLIAGWSTARAEFGLVAGWGPGGVGPGDSRDVSAGASGGQDLEVRQVLVPRPDVAAHFGLESGEGLGIVLVAECAEDRSVRLSWRADGRVGTSCELRFSPPSGIGELGERERAVFGPALGLLAMAYEPFSQQWLWCVKQLKPSTAPCPAARGHLEGAAAVEMTGDGLVFGWAVHAPASTVWLEDGSGQLHALRGGYRQFRQDVHDAAGHAFAHGSGQAGFTVHVQGLKPGSMVRLKAIAETGVHILHEVPCSALPVDPVGAARVLFGIGASPADLHRRIQVVDAPVIGPLIAHRQGLLAELPVRSRVLGTPPAHPTASVIVPLYGRVDFVEHQIIELSRDPWFAAHAELIYVLDDPSLVEAFVADAESLYRLYELPFRWLWGSVNRGFAGANNLGAGVAKGEHLVFLNSDAFPQGPGWVEALVGVLEARSDVGAVGPRLVFADGSIQHAGMTFMRREELGIWVNHHPLMGLDPSLDCHDDLSIVPAVTGACLAVRRGDFERVGGWDTGYLIGDFEDSDLCLKLRSLGLKSAYLPSVQLTHLERQSFKLLGQDQFRFRTVIYNAVRHQGRWGDELQALTSEAGAGDGA